MHLSARVGIMLMALCPINNVQACDVCGCSVSSQSLGLLPQFSKHFVGIQYLYATSKSSHPSLFEGKPNEESTQVYQYTQLWGRFQINKLFQLFAFVPYVHNNNKELSQSSTSSGIGDLSAIINYSFPLAEKANMKRMLLGGIGLKMPTGVFNSGTNAERNGLPNTQTGTGSWDILSNINFTQKGKKWGCNIDASYILTTANKWEYKFGNRLNTAAMAFYWLEYKHLKVAPQSGVRIEYALHDYDHYSKKWLNEKTGGIMTFATLGTQIFYKYFGAKAVISIPAYQQYAAGYVRSNSRFEGGVFILF
jgi:hypothetical protein